MEQAAAAAQRWKCGMSGLLDFFTKEAGQKRRAWLDEKDAELTGLLSYFAGPHASDAAGKAGGLLATMSDAADFQDYTDASRATMRDPNLGNLAALATAGTALMIPGVSARMAEGAVDFGQDVARFGREEDGAIRAFHGSPHDFDKFSMDKIGTGEGAQAYGHGLYFAEAEDTARSYRDQLSNIGADGYANAHQNAKNLVARLGGDADYAAEVLRDQMAALGPDNINSVKLQETLEFIESGKFLNPAPGSGHMYEVNINADPADFLDWDAPLSEQPQGVQWLAKDNTEYLRNAGISVRDDMAGSEVVRSMRPEQYAGYDIPGIKYRDAMSRDGAGEGTRNYVVFDDNLIDIVRKYGWAAALPLLSQQQDNRDTQ